MTGTLAPPPRYGREDESILLDSGRQHTGTNQSKYNVRGHTRGQSWVSVGGSNARTQTMQSDISLSSLPNHSPPGYSSFSDGEESEDEQSVEEEQTLPETNDETPLIERREDTE